MKTPITTQEMDRIVKLKEHFTTEEVCEITARSRETINRVWLCYRYAAEGNANKLFCNAYQETIKSWAAAKFGIERPQAKPTQKAEEAPAPAAEGESEKAKESNEAVAMLKTLEALRDVVDRLNTLLDVTEGLASTVGRVAGAVRNAQQAAHEDAEKTRQYINANADILHSDIAQYKDVLNGIKANTRPRGQNG